MKIKDKYNEVWKDYSRPQDNWKESQKYQVSNYGRVVSLKTGKPYMIKLAKTSGYDVSTSIQCNDGKSRSFYVHHAVAELFLQPKIEGQTRIIHLDFNKTNNVYSNLKWVNDKEWWEHYAKNPNVIKARGRITYSKLTPAKVAILKRKLFDPNRKTRLKMLAKQFGVSEMQLHRIKTGENWGHIKPAK